jgi:hypothetical protein
MRFRPRGPDRPAARPAAAAIALALTLVALAILATVGLARQPRSGPQRRAAGCPASDRTAVLSTRPGADAALVPAGATSLLLCRYNGLPNPPPLNVPGKPAFGLVSSARVGDAARVARLASELDALPAGGDYAIACPADFGDDVVAYFGYPAGAEDPVTVDLSGCNTVTNGSLHRLGLDAPVVARLASLVPLPPARRGVLSGYVERCGGPYPGGCSIAPIDTCTPGGSCYRSDRVSVTTAAGAAVASTRLRGARFTLALKPGRYVLRLLGDGPKIHGRVLQTRRATVRAGHTTSVRFFFAFP